VEVVNTYDNSAGAAACEFRWRMLHLHRPGDHHVHIGSLATAATLLRERHRHTVGGDTCSGNLTGLAQKVSAREARSIRASNRFHKKNSPYSNRFGMGEY
jgi:hypothetical protein